MYCSPWRDLRAWPALRAAAAVSWPSWSPRSPTVSWRGRGAGPFDPRAAWEETRSFFYLAIIYVLACNLIQTRAQLRIFVWLFIAAIGLKSVQGIVRYVDVRANGLQVDAITGPRGCSLLCRLRLLLVGAAPLRGEAWKCGARRQTRVMLVVLPPLSSPCW